MEQLNSPLYVLLGISGLLILPLNNLGRNVFMNVGVGLWNTYNMVTGILGDLLSYIRLFALGISSAIMGFVFNSLAVEMSGSIPVLNVIIMVIILVIGHSINIFMSGLGAFVHPLRLTFVEFYKNAGFSGGGKKYEPFRKLT
jgi:V/A-type H+-transporting ATPase subunit I